MNGLSLFAFGHSCAGLFDALEHEIGMARTQIMSRRRKYESLLSRWINADDNPRFAEDLSLCFAFNQKLNVELRRLFQKLVHDGFVNRNELEEGESTADSYCVFDERQVSAMGEEMIHNEDFYAHRAA